MIVRLILIGLFFSICFAYTVNYNIENNNLHVIDSHFILNASNATVLKGDSIFDIYRLEFIVSNSKNIKYNKAESVDEAILRGRDYEYDEKKGVVKISKKNYAKVQKDSKGGTKQKPMMIFCRHIIMDKEFLVKIK